MEKKRVNRNRLFLWILSASTIILLALTIVGLIFFYYQVDSYQASGIEDYQTYSKLYVYIADSPDSTVSDNLYQELREYGLQNDCYVERLGDDLVTSYSKEEMIEIAIKSKVSGIILEADDSEETAALIDKADAAGIPVITVMTDAPNSSRCSFIGMNNYSAGTEYGNLVLTAASYNGLAGAKALVLMSSGDSNESALYMAIQEKLSGSNIALSSAVIESDSAFSAEEKIIDVLDEYDPVPDIIVCLSDINTRCAYQYIVDKNLVGITTIIGYYDSDTVLEGIERGAIEATFSVDTEQVAKYCVDALNEYYEMGYVNGYFDTNYVLINKSNVSDYISTDNGEEVTDETA